MAIFRRYMLFADDVLKSGREDKIIELTAGILA